MEKSNFLFEIGTEEIPAGYILNAVDKLNESFINDLKDYQLSYTDIEMYSTPRRLAIKIIDLDRCQTDQEIEKIGPSKRAAYDENGNISKAGQGFLTGAGATEQDVFIMNTPKGEYIAVKVFVKGKETVSILPILMKSAIERIVFPKTMKWGDQNFLFARPIRWFMSMLDDEVIEFEFNGIKSRNISYGNRFERLNNADKFYHADEYPKRLKKIKVNADRQVRKNFIQGQLDQIGGVLKDEKLLDTVTDLVEYPSAVKASFDSKYLELPSKIITSTLSQNQKYFFVTNEAGELQNEFVFISNGDPKCSDVIRIGNEKVVKARLEDALFYYKEDTKKPISDYVHKLSEVVFHAKLGTIQDKIERISKICEYIFDCQSSVLKEMSLASTDLKGDILRSAHLCKADLVTLMLGEKEFTKLQGYIGMNYAIINGEKPEVARAIYEHYMPRGQNDDLPSHIIGAILAIADKIDTVCGIIGVGLMPTGSNDPFAIRRNANGIVQIIDKFNLDLSLTALINHSLILLKDRITEPEKQKAVILDYFKQRIKWFMETKNIEYDVINSLDIYEWDNIREISVRAFDLQSFKPLKEFEVLVTGYKRVNNILDKNRIDFALNPEILKDVAEINLYKHLQKINNDIIPALEKMNYKEIMSHIVPLGASIDDFFDNVLVMCEDINLKNNRLALLNQIKMLFLKVADISRIMTKD